MVGRKTLKSQPKYFTTRLGCSSFPVRLPFLLVHIVSRTVPLHPDQSAAVSSSTTWKSTFHLIGNVKSEEVLPKENAVSLATVSK